MPQAILKVTPEWFTALLSVAQEGGTRHYGVLENGLPSDARVIEVSTGPRNDWIKIVIESASFPEIEEGDPIPVLDPPRFVIYYDDPVSSDEPQPF